MLRKRILLLSLVLVFTWVFTGCEADDPLMDPLYTDNIFAGSAGRDIGSAAQPYEDIYANNFHGSGAAGGDVVGPAGAVDGNVVSFDGATGKLIQDSGVAAASLGDVTGPAGATDHAVARFDTVTGKLIQDSSGVTIDDFNNLTVDGDIDTVSGDINSGNDVNVTNDLDVTDAADIGGNLSVTGTSTFNDQIVLASDGLVWIELRPDLEASKIAMTTKPTTIIRGATHGYSLPVGGVDEELYYDICVPGRWDGESDIVIEADAWLDTAQDHALDAVKLQVEWQQIGDGDEVPVTFTTVTDEVVTGIVNQFTCIKFEFVIDYDVVGADPIQGDDTIFFHLTRIASSQEIDGEPVIYHVSVDRKYRTIGG